MVESSKPVSAIEELTQISKQQTSGSTGQEKKKKKTLWDQKNNLADEYFRPYEITKDIDQIKEECELCKTMEPCCPEHCCDWDSWSPLTCPKYKDKLKDDAELQKALLEEAAKQGVNGDRPASAWRRTFDTSTWKNVYEPTDEPTMKMFSSEADKVEINNAKKKNLELLTKDQRKKAIEEEERKDYLDRIPNEMIYCEEGEGAIIQNFEVEVQQEEELAMTSGVRGLRALRAQRNLIEKKIAVDQKQADEGENRFDAYEKRKAEKKLQAPKTLAPLKQEQVLEL